ncbi:MAG TPA: TetR/AcrR family transcriptional regulator [Steroidobacteraceae bacterium]|nr:TetR/AcrR family transcriptional regulator [Steroidobacteraceae bacterium]
MSKGDETRQRILERAAPLLNRQGFQAAPVSEIMRVTGLQKGGLYNHFESKEELALAAFDLLMERIEQKVGQVHRSHSSPLAQLHAHIDLIAGGGTRTEGGCPMANSMVESDDSNPALRKRVVKVLEKWRALLTHTVARGIVAGELRADVNPDEVATRIITSLEGGHLLRNFYDEPRYLKQAGEFLREYIERDLRAPRAAAGG